MNPLYPAGRSDSGGDAVTSGTTAYKSAATRRLTVPQLTVSQLEALEARTAAARETHAAAAAPDTSAGAAPAGRDGSTAESPADTSPPPSTVAAPPAPAVTGGAGGSSSTQVDSSSDSDVELEIFRDQDLCTVNDVAPRTLSRLLSMSTAASGTRVPHLSFGSCSVTGYDPYNVKTNQDSLVCTPFFGGVEHQSLWGVFDGHGPGGEKVAGFLRQHLPSVVARAEPLESDPTRALEAAFEELRGMLVDAAPGMECKLRFCGSTAVCILIVGTSLWCANVGDSRAVLGRRNESGAVAALPLSRDHKPDDEVEKPRLEAAGAVVRPAKHPITGESFGVPRVWASGDAAYPGLAMARAFGDLAAAELGVVATPEVKEHKLQRSDDFIVLGSDGVFEFMPDNDVAQFVADQLAAGGTALDAVAEALCRAASARWEEEEDAIDDISAVIVRLSWPE